MRDTGSEHVWSKTGSRIRLPRARRVSLKTLLIAAPLLAATAFAMVGFVAAPAGSPKSPPPPAVAGPTTTATPQGSEAVLAERPSPPPSPVESGVEQPMDWTPQLSYICKPAGVASHYVVPPPSSSAATAITYSGQGAITVFDPATNTSHVVVPAGRQCSYVHPRFVDRRTLAFLNDYSIEIVDIASGRVRILTTALGKTDWAMDFAIDRVNGRISVLAFDPKGNENIIVSSLSTGRTLFRKKVGVLCACDGGAPTGVEWSKDGTMLLVSAGIADGNVYVFDQTGRTVFPKAPGWDAHWLGATHSFIFNSTAKSFGEWTRVNVATGKRTLVFKADVNSTSYIQPASSPDGSRFAITDQENGRVAWFDFQTRKLTSIDGDHAYPIWLDNDRLAFSGVKTCNCEYPAFSPTGAVGALSLGTRSWTRMHMTQTIDADVLF